MISICQKIVSKQFNIYLNLQKLYFIKKSNNNNKQGTEHHAFACFLGKTTSDLIQICFMNHTVEIQQFI